MRQRFDPCRGWFTRLTLHICGPSLTGRTARTGGSGGRSSCAVGVDSNPLALCRLVSALVQKRQKPLRLCRPWVQHGPFPGNGRSSRALQVLPRLHPMATTLCITINGRSSHIWPAWGRVVRRRYRPLLPSKSIWPASRRGGVAHRRR